MIKAKLNYYLPKRVTNNKDFIESILKICIHNIIKKLKLYVMIIKLDLLTLITKDLELILNLKWTSYDEYYYKYLKIIIKKIIMIMMLKLRRILL